MSPLAKNILLQSSCWCLDATHKTTNIDNYWLYTVVVCHPVTVTGCPVAYCYTTDHSVTPIAEFLSFLKDKGCTRVLKITIDVSHVELNAITSIYPEVQVQWCLFHVTRALVTIFGVVLLFWNRASSLGNTMSDVAAVEYDEEDY